MYLDTIPTYMYNATPIDGKDAGVYCTVGSDIWEKYIVRVIGNICTVHYKGGGWREWRGSNDGEDPS